MEKLARMTKILWLDLFDGRMGRMKMTNVTNSRQMLVPCVRDQVTFSILLETGSSLGEGAMNMSRHLAMELTQVTRSRM